jgi:hypothetical protein
MRALGREIRGVLGQHLRQGEDAGARPQDGLRPRSAGDKAATYVKLTSLMSIETISISGIGRRSDPRV